MVAKELISIIIPMYGVEEYLPQCLDSVCGQTWENLEILLIDDDSPDRSGEIAEEYASKDHRIKVFHIKNRGAAGARNVGLEHAKGSFVMFVDSDDWLESDAAEKLMSVLKEQGADLAQCQYMDEYITGSVLHIRDAEPGVYSSEQFLQRMLSTWEDILIWNKVFSRKVLEGVLFEEGHCIDDEFFTYKTVILASRIAVTEEVLYHYRQRRSGAMKNSEKARQRFNDQIEFITKRYEPIISSYPGLQKEVLWHLIEVLMHVIRGGAAYKEVFQRAKKELRKYGKKVLFSSFDLRKKKTITSYLLRTRAWFLKRFPKETNDMEGCFP